MLTLAATESLRGVAGSATAITYTITGDAKGVTDDFKVLAQGQLPAVGGTLYAAPGSTSALVQKIFMANTTAGAVTAGLYINGTAGTNLIFACTLEANGSAVFAHDGWKTYDSAGKQLFVGSTGAQGIQGIQGEKGWSPVLAVVTDGARRVFQITSWVGGAGTPPSSTNQFIGAVGIVGTAAAAVDVRGAAGADAIAFLSVTGNTGTATADTNTDSLSIVGTGVISTVASDNPEVLTISSAALTGHVTSVGAATIISPGVVTNAMQTNMAANTLSGNPTSGAASPSDIALAANRFLGRKAAGDITAYTITDAGFDFLAAADAAAETALLNAATSTLKGLILAAEKNRISTADLWFDVVADGGIDRTGVIDGTTILQNAINTVGAAGGGTVYIPFNCTIKTSANINISNPFVTIKGGSRVTSKIVPTHATGNVFTVAAGAGPNGFVRFETMRIQPATNNLRTAGYGIEVTSTVPNCSIQWVDILFQWSAIKASGQLCRMEDLGLRECGYGAINGCMILFDQFTDQYVKAVVCDNGTVGPNAPMAGFSGVRITSLSSLLMADCQWIHCGIGLEVVPGAALAVPSIYCMNTFFDQGTIGASFVSGSGSIVRNRFIGCWFSGNSIAGVVINGTAVNGLDFIGCEFYGAPSQPLGIDAQSAVEWSVRASRIAGNSTAGIRTTAGANHSFSITDCIIGQVSGVGANALGVNIQAGAYNRYQILDNRGLDTNTTVGITDNGTTTYPSQKNVSNNMGAGQISGAAVRLIPPVTVPSLLTTEQVAITLPIAGNAVSAGTTFRIRIRGQAGAAGTLTGRLKVGAAAGIGTGTVVLLATSGTLAANAWFVMDFDCTVGTPGAAAPISGGGNAVFISTAVGIATAAYTVPTIATTAPWWLTVTLAQGTAAGAVTLRHATIFVDSIN